MTNFGTPFAQTGPMPGSNTTSSYIPMRPLTSGNQNNPTGAAGGTTTAYGAPVYGSGDIGTGSTSLIPGASTSNSFNSILFPGTTATGANNQVSSGTQTQRQTDRTLGELQNYYGEGIGSYIFNLMQNGGMNPALTNLLNSNILNAMQGPLNQGSANLNALLGAQGLSGNSSTSALANSNYWQQATANENAQISKNYMDQYQLGQQFLSNILPGVLQTNQQGTANESNWMDYLNQGLQFAGSAMMFL